MLENQIWKIRGKRNDEELVRCEAWVCAWTLEAIMIVWMWQPNAHAPFPPPFPSNHYHYYFYIFYFHFFILYIYSGNEHISNFEVDNIIIFMFFFSFCFYYHTIIFSFLQLIQGDSSTLKVVSNMYV